MVRKLGCLVIVALFGIQMAATATPTSPVKVRKTVPSSRAASEVVREQSAVVAPEQDELLKSKPSGLYTESDDIC